jgi:hypothetical protein
LAANLASSSLHRSYEVFCAFRHQISGGLQLIEAARVDRLHRAK